MAYLFRIYNRFIESNPFVGNCITSGVCYGAGDALAQQLKRKWENVKNMILLEWLHMELLDCVLVDRLITYGLKNSSYGFNNQEFYDSS
jgi:hypothetical protein